MTRYAASARTYEVPAAALSFVLPWKRPPTRTYVRQKTAETTLPDSHRPKDRLAGVCCVSHTITALTASTAFNALGASRGTSLCVSYPKVEMIERLEVFMSFASVFACFGISTQSRTKLFRYCYFFGRGHKQAFVWEKYLFLLTL